MNRPCTTVRTSVNTTPKHYIFHEVTASTMARAATTKAAPRSTPLRCPVDGSSGQPRRRWRRRSDFNVPPCNPIRPRQSVRLSAATEGALVRPLARGWRFSSAVVVVVVPSSSPFLRRCSLRPRRRRGAATRWTHRRRRRRHRASAATHSTGNRPTDWLATEPRPRQTRRQTGRGEHCCLSPPMR